MVRLPLTGNMLAYFQYVLGLQRLGHEVAYLEESGWPRSCYDPEAGDWGESPVTGLRRMKELLSAYGLDIPVCYVDRDTGRVYGAVRAEVKRILGEADLLLNVGGVCWLNEFRLCKRRALIDMDPLFTQVGDFGSKMGDDYTARFTYGANIGTESCVIPTNGKDWMPTIPPVVPELWEAGPAPAGAPLTTVANWSAYEPVIYEGERFGQKDEEFLRMIDLPLRTSDNLEIALSGAGPAIVSRLRSAGWSVRGGEEVSGSVGSYRAYIVGSKGEFSVAKHAYVRSYSGWFSDRSVCYLAAARPVILQDTGFTEWLPAGKGVLAFSDLEEAAACIEELNAGYQAHCIAARQIAERVFSYRVVLPSLLNLALREDSPSRHFIGQRRVT
jgi:hypothetical protein